MKKPRSVLPPFLAPTSMEIQTEILEDYEPLIELRNAFERGDKQTFDGVLAEISSELADEYRAKIEDKVKRWATATVAQRFDDTAATRAYIQTKMLYRDGFYEATIMVARSIAEMFVMTAWIE